MQEQQTKLSTLLPRRWPTSVWRCVLCVLLAHLCACEGEPSRFTNATIGRSQLVGTWDLDFGPDARRKFAQAIREEGTPHYIPWAVIQLKAHGECLVRGPLVVGEDGILRRTEGEERATWRMRSGGGPRGRAQVFLTFRVPPAQPGWSEGSHIQTLYVMKRSETLTLWRYIGRIRHHRPQEYTRRPKNESSSSPDIEAAQQTEE